MWLTVNHWWLVVIIWNLIVCSSMADPSQEDLAKLGAAFYALGAKPEYTASQLDKWMEVQYEETLKMRGGEIKPDAKGSDTAVSSTNQTFLQVHTSRLPNFSGDDCKGDVSYTHWKYDVKCLLSEHKEQTIMNVIRRSLKGTASDVLQHLGEHASVKDISLT